jgi:hypothetical protein
VSPAKPAAPAAADHEAVTTATPAPQPQYLCGIVPAAVADAGLADLPAGAAFVPYRQIAGLTMPAPAGSSRQLRATLLAYTDLLDRAAAAGPVLPVRYGTTLPSAAAVERDVLQPCHDSFARALADLVDRAQFTVRARYLPDAVVQEVLAEQPEAVHLHRQGADQRARAQLGELVAKAIAGKRAADSETLVYQLGRYAVSVVVQPCPTLDLERLADLACLVERPQRASFEQAVAELAERWQDRARLRLLGPMAPYHFVGDLTGAQLGRW